jgi:gliding motility-associated-like protein
MTLSQPDAISVTVTQGIGSNDHLGYADATSTGGAGTHSYNWSNGALTQDVIGLQSGTYYLTVTDQMGCTAMDTILIEIDVLIPTAITPNADGKNDDFEILGVGSFPKLTIEIYTRWGAKIFFFEGTGLEYCQPSNRWDGTHNGKDLPIGAYQYIISLEGYSEPFTGQVVLMR